MNLFGVFNAFIYTHCFYFLVFFYQNRLILIFREMTIYLLKIPNYTLKLLLKYLYVFSQKVDRLVNFVNMLSNWN